MNATITTTVNSPRIVPASTASASRLHVGAEALQVGDQRLELGLAGHRFGRAGRYVVCSSHSIIDSIPPANYRAMIEHYLDAADGDVELTIEAMAKAGYAGNGLAFEPTPAQMTNLSAQIRHIAEYSKRDRT